MTCCFIGHRKIVVTTALEHTLNNIIIRLIKIGVNEFVFGDHSDFDDICYNIVSELRKLYPHIRRIKYRKDYPHVKTGDYSMQFFIGGYEDCFFPAGTEKAGRAAYVKRNQAMIRHSDYCVFYISEKYVQNHSTDRKSGTKIAFDYAKSKHKNIINVLDYIQKPDPST